MLTWHAFGDASGSGGLADFWTDTSGNGIHASEAGSAKPTLLANGAVSFVAGKKLTASGTGNVAQPVTFCLRMKASGTTVQRFFGAQDGAAIYIDGSTFRLNAGSDVNSTVAFTADTWLSVIVVFNGTSSAVYRTGSSGTGLNPGTNGIGGGAGISFNDPSFFGGATWQCAEAITYASVLSAGEITQTLEYLDTINPA
jgi:hypothetical protein